LVGFGIQEGLRHAVCFEPEVEAPDASTLGEIAPLSDELFNANPESKIWNSYAPLHESRQRALRDNSRARALEAVLAESPAGEGMTFRAGMSGLVDERYEVHPVLAFPSMRWESKPRLNSRIRERLAVEPSFQDALAARILERATHALRGREAPQDFGTFGDDMLFEDIVVGAARRLTGSAAVLAGYVYGSELHAAMDAVAAQPYEGRSSLGRVVLAGSGHPEVETRLAFVDPIPIGSTRRFRKALEMTNDELSLLCDGAILTGLGAIRPAESIPPTEEDPEGDFLAQYDDFDPDESLFDFDVMGRGEWQLSFRSTPLLRVANTRPAFPDQPLSQARFKDVASRLFADATEKDLGSLWDLASAASKADHGTILVVHRDAAAEAERLAPQAQRLSPVVLDNRVVSAVTSIDGAVLVDPSGRCHAVGVILDGVATGDGDPGRGARYNSAIRYHAAVGVDALIVIVSEDGMIDLVPSLNRRIKREEVERPIATAEESAASGDFQAFFRSWAHLEALAFYLDADQCARANSARESLEEIRAKEAVDPETGLGKIARVSWKPFDPHAGMSAEYYLPE
jgi:hypothetical protein